MWPVKVDSLFSRTKHTRRTEERLLGKFGVGLCPGADPALEFGEGHREETWGSGGVAPRKI